MKWGPHFDSLKQHNIISFYHGEIIVTIFENVEENESACMIQAVLIQQIFTLFLFSFQALSTCIQIRMLLQSFYDTYMHTHFYVLLYPLRFFTLSHCLQIYHIK